MLLNHQAVVSTTWAESGLQTVQCICTFYVPSVKGRSYLIRSVNRPRGARELKERAIVDGDLVAARIYRGTTNMVKPCL